VHAISTYFGNKFVEIQDPLDVTFQLHFHKLLSIISYNLLILFMFVYAFTYRFCIQLLQLVNVSITIFVVVIHSLCCMLQLASNVFITCAPLSY